MYKRFALISVSIGVLFFATSSSIQKSSTGIAGYTGAPGESTCATFGCHGGGSSSSTNVTVTSVPSFSNGQYMSDSIYQITVTILAAGFNRYGFDCEVLDSNLLNAGTMQAPGAGVKFLNAGAKKNATHTTPKFGVGGASFTFNWVAPTDGKATFYLCGNAVNFNGNTSGDLVLPYSLSLYPVPVVQQDTTSTTDAITEVAAAISAMHVYPVPAANYAQLQYKLNKNGMVRAELVSLDGRETKLMFEEKQAATDHARILDLNEVPAGAYFLRLTCDGKKVTQKMITVQ